MKGLVFIKGSAIALLAAIFLLPFSSAKSEVSVIHSLRLEKDPRGCRYVIEKTGAVDVQDFVLSDPDRVVVDFIGSKYALGSMVFEGDGRLVERVRTSQFADAPEEITRVVFDLNAKGRYQIEETENAVVVQFQPREERQGAGPVGTMGASVSPWSASSPWRVDTPEPSSAPAPVSGATPAPVGTTAPVITSATKGADKAELPAPGGMARAKGTLAGRETSSPAARAWSPHQRESGGGIGLMRKKNITIDVQSADIKTVLQSISEFANVNIISGPEVTGEVTAHLKNVPWREALSIILKAHGFGYREEYGIIRVSTIEKLTKEELEKEAAERKKDDLLPLVTRIIALSYANAGEIKDALDKMVSSRGNIEVEKGNNALIVTDIQKNVDKVEVMAKALDKKTEQVEIVARLVDVDVASTKELGIRWDFLNLAPANVSVMGDAVIDAAPSASPIGTFRIGTVRSWGELKSVIEMLEETNRANIISNPRVVTADNREARILVGKEIPLIVADEAGNPITELTKIGIILQVTPHVNSDHTITMDLHPEVSELAKEATVQGGVIITMSEADTRVLVNNGETAVIGGLISEVENTTEQGLPVLKDVPILGNLFKFKSKTKRKRELIIFVTPRIVSTATSRSS